MAVLPDSRRVANAVTQHVAEVLTARAVLIDERGEVVAASGDTRGNGAHDDTLRLPVRLDGEQFQLLVDGPLAQEDVPERLRRLLVELVVNQSATVTGARRHDILKDRFIHALLGEPISNEADVLREAQILGMDLTRPRAVILVDASPYLLDASWRSEATIRERVHVVIAAIVRHFHLPNDMICAHIGEGEVVVLKAIRREDMGAWADRRGHVSLQKASWANIAALKSASNELLQLLRKETGATITIGVGRYHPRVRGLGRSYQDARAALALGRRLFGGDQVYSLDQLGAAAMVGVTDERTRLDLAQRILAPIDAEPELLETLTKFFANDCSLARTSQALAIHRNTLGYRLDKIAALTDLDPRRFDDALQLRLASLVRSLTVGTSLGHLHDITGRDDGERRSSAQRRVS